MTASRATAQDVRDLAWLRRVRDRIDREYAQPLEVEALARCTHMSTGHLSREFKRAYGESPYSYLMTRRIERADPAASGRPQHHRDLFRGGLPADQPYGVRGCAFRDPTGNLIRIQEVHRG